MGKRRVNQNSVDAFQVTRYVICFVHVEKHIGIHAFDAKVNVGARLVIEFDVILRKTVNALMNDEVEVKGKGGAVINDTLEEFLTPFSGRSESFVYYINSTIVGQVFGRIMDSLI